ncbi:PLD nuclease N-terminal domain-containing protein [Promicromonospora soli]|uniref:Cardiolipin synthase N-terminal domain-containing protein n=1 Tax=Promicromonospora soli TaxID=2035533 RepID=A0A919KQ47_9MICO|nr:PLD nuclease N-terminal domain-containing protein [Promicromonospora soli]GHH68604.1 hypothetical protein GCM10017772_12020 [Promicromonospora soli]
MPRLVFFLLYLALVVYALVDVIQAEDEDLGGIQKGFWIIAIVFLPLAGSIAWIVVSNGARRRRAGSRDQVTGFPAAQPAPAQYSRRVRSWEQEAAPLAPEDDSEFIWLMEQAKRKREREASEGTGRTEGAEPGGENERQGGEGHVEG